MRVKISSVICVIVLNLALLEVCNSNSDLNPYTVLGVSRSANEKQIRNAYRKLAKDWHPDKNKAPEAHEKFMQINQAYEILSDSERRSLYDDYGTTNEPRDGGGGAYQRESYDQFFRQFHFGGFEGFFGGRGAGGGDGFKSNRKSLEDEINKKTYEEIILPNSHAKPYLIFLYTEFCFSCMTVDNVWQTLKQEIKSLGFGAGHSDASWNRELAKMLGISTVPSIVGIVNDRVYHFRGEFTLKNLKEFVRKLIPSKLLIQLNENNFNQTLLSTLSENKVLSVYASHSTQITLKYQMPCFQMVNNIKCAFIKLNTIDAGFVNYLKKQHKIDLSQQQQTTTTINKQDVFLIFKENLTPQSQTHKPLHQISSNDISYAQILQTFETNKFLHLPRLSSINHFFDLCPSWTQLNFDTTNLLRVVCVVFLSASDENKPRFLLNENVKVKLVKKVSSDEYFKKNAQFTYVNLDVQSDFAEKLEKLTNLDASENNKSKRNSFENKILLLKRVDDRQAQLDFFDFNGDLANDAEVSQQLEIVKAYLKSVLSGERKLQHKITTPVFYDETHHNFMQSILDYFDDVYNYLTERFFWESVLGNSSYMMILFCAVLFIWLMMLFSSEKSNPNAAASSKTKPKK